MAEHLSCKQKVPGSIPGGGTLLPRWFGGRLITVEIAQLERIACYFRFSFTRRSTAAVLDGIRGETDHDGSLA